MTGTATATTRQRYGRKNNTFSPWHTPLPLTKNRSASTKKKRTTFGGAVCLSLLCVLLFFCAIFSSTSLPEIQKKSIIRRRRASGSLLNSHQSQGGAETRRSVQYVDLPEIASSSRRYDVIVVGCGPAGLTAALFASRMGMSVLVFGSPSTGSLSGTSSFDNFPSYIVGQHGGGGGGGQGWIDATMEQASSFGARFAPPTYVATGLAKTKTERQDASEFEVRLSLGTDVSEDLRVVGKTVIVASGSVPRKLDLPRETSLWGRSIHNCALCDGDVYVRNDAKKSVAVVGGGDAAVEAIFLLHKLGVETIHWIHRREDYRASAVEVERVRQLPNVDVWTPYVVVEWKTKEGDEAGSEINPGSMTLEGIRIVGAKDGVADPEATSSLTIPCDGVFLMIGSTPNSKWLQSSGIDIDPNTKLVRLPPFADGASQGNNRNNLIPQLSTSIGGVFAAGEVLDGVYRQALTASADGAKAAIDAQRYLHHLGMEASLPTRYSRAVNDRANIDAKKPQKKSVRNKSEKKGARHGDCDLTEIECIKSVVSSHPVVVFSKNYCPYCRRALEALRTLTEPYVIDLTEIADGMKVQTTLGSLTGRRTVPNVFIGGKSIGGGDETVALFRDGKLGGLILKANMN